ncbi:MAG: MobA/MobL family protein [Pseudomonadota bacterium]
MGKSTHASGAAAAQVAYITRPSAIPDVEAFGMPSETRAAMAWFNQAERQDRKNARVADRIIVALPLDSDHEERISLLRDFCTELTGRKVPHIAAIHDKGKDTNNPHAHILVRDRDLESGRGRVLRWSGSPADREAAGLPKNAKKHIREVWEAQVNRAL